MSVVPKAGFACRFYREGDDPSMLDVLAAAFKGWPRVQTGSPPLDHLRWKLSSHPLATQYTAIADCQGQIVGMRLFLVRELAFCGQTLLAYNAADIAVHPAFRDIGVLRELVALDYACADRPPAVDTFDLKLAYESRHPAVLRLQHAIPGVYRLGNALQVLSLEGPGRVGAGDGTGVVIREAAAFDSRMEAFWVEAASAFDVSYPRSADVMNWRYATPAAGAFHIAVAEDRGRLVGYVVTRRSRQRGYIADMLAVPGRDDVVSGLIAHGVSSLGPESLDRVECWLPANHPYQRALRDAGFRPKETNLRINYRPCLKTSDQLELLGDPATRVHFMAGDTDLV